MATRRRAAGPSESGATARAGGADGCEPGAAAPHVRAGDVQFTGNLGNGAFVDIPQKHDLTVRRRQLVDRLQQHPQQLAALQDLVRTRGVRSAFDGWKERRAVLPRRPVACFVTHDGADPTARGRHTSILVELLQHDDPAVLESILCGYIVTGDPSGHGQEPRRAASKPRLGIAVEQRTPNRVLDAGKPRHLVGHP